MCYIFAEMIVKSRSQRNRNDIRVTCANMYLRGMLSSFILAIKISVTFTISSHVLLEPS
jgi:hypothetical protein